MAYIDFVEQVHSGTKRNYLDRVVSVDKAACAEIAKRFGKEYWDGSRDTGYGGYKYDGRWRAVAEKMVKHYGIKTGDRILDVGCGKGFLMYEFTQLVPGVKVAGLDISQYAIDNAKPEVKEFIKHGNAVSLPYPDKNFDLVISINTIHNLYLYDLVKSLRELERVGKGGKGKYVMMDSYRTEREKVNLLYWQLTCECIFTPKEWEYTFELAGYTGDYGCIFFE